MSKTSKAQRQNKTKNRPETSSGTQQHKPIVSNKKILMSLLSRYKMILICCALLGVSLISLRMTTMPGLIMQGGVIAVLIGMRIMRIVKQEQCRTEQASSQQQEPHEEQPT